MSANPQLENGYLRIATEWFEAFLQARYPAGVKDFVLCIVRETWGWNETYRNIPTARIADLMNVSASRVKQLRLVAVGCNLIEWTPGKGNTSSGRYRVQKDFTSWTPAKSSGKWAEVTQTGQYGVSGYTDCPDSTGCPVSGQDGVSSIRIVRGVQHIDSERQSTDNTLSENAETASASSDPTADAIAEKERIKREKLMREAVRMRQQTERYDAAYGSLPEEDKQIADTMIVAQAEEKGRQLTLLQQAQLVETYRDELADHGPQCWRECCRIALEKAHGSVAYAKGCTKTWVPKATAPALSLVGPQVQAPAVRPLDPDFAKRWDEERNARRLTDAN